METQQIIYWLYDKAARAQDHAYARMLNLAAQRLKELDHPQKTAHWVIHTSTDDIWAECSECRTCGNPKWKVCPVCEARMVSTDV